MEMKTRIKMQNKMQKNFFMKHKLFCIFGILAILLILMAVFAPVVTGGADPAGGNLKDAVLPPGPEHLFGTDQMGRDIFTRVVYGARVSLISAFSVVGLSFGIGTALGILAGYFRGPLDALLMRLADMMVSFPGLVFAMAVAGILGAAIHNAVLAVAVVTWPKYARLARSLVLKIRGTDYVAAAVTTGSKHGYLMLRYMLPNALPTLVVTAATDIGSLMLELAALSFLGFGAVPPTPEWGLMLSEGRAYMQTAPWLMIFPGLAILVTVIIFNMLGDGLRDILDPRQEG